MSDKNEKQISAYQFICQCLETTPGTPYAFQDALHAGKDDVAYTLFRNDMPGDMQDKFSKVCCDLLVEAVSRQIVTEELSNALSMIPQFTYAKAFLRRIRSYSDEVIIDRDQLYRFALMLARDCAVINEVKLGIYALSRLFTYAFLETDVKEFAVSRMLVDKYMTAAEKHVKEFIDLSALVLIDHSMTPFWKQSGDDVQKSNGWSSDHENAIRDQCAKYQRSDKYRWNRLITEMDEPTESNAVIIKVLTSYAFDYSFPLPTFEAFSHMLDRDPFDMDIAKFVLIDHPQNYAAEIAERILSVVPSDVLEKPEILDKDELTPKHRPDVWLIYLLKARKTVKFECEQLCRSCLSARFQDLRIEAITTLRLIRAQWSSAVIPALEKACETEPDPKIAKRIKRLLGIKVDDKKEQRYVDVGDITVSSSVADKPILDTEIAGTFFRDMDVVTGVLEDGDTLFLKREPDNKYDSNAILVTTEDGYVLGYIPKAENPPLAQLMDAGEKLYAILGVDPTCYEGKPPITVYISRAVSSQGNIIQFPGGLQ